MSGTEWHLQALLLTSDKEVQEQISSAFNKTSKVVQAKNHQEAFLQLDQRPFQVMIVDEVELEVKPYSDEPKPPSIFEICQYASQLNQHLTIILLVNKFPSNAGDFARKSGANLIMNRNEIGLNRMLYVIQIMRKRTFRTVLCRDLPLDVRVPVEIWHYRPMADRYSVFLREGESFSTLHKDKIAKSKVFHIFVKEQEFPKLVGQLNLSRSQELSSIRNQYRQLLSQFFNFSHEGHLHTGIEMLNSGMEIVARLEKLIASFPSAYEALEELPYPRWSALAHGINCAIYAIIFAKICQRPQVQELAFAALIHNVGLSDFDQKLLNRSEADFTKAQLQEYQKHSLRTIEMAHAMNLPLTPVMELAITHHHENYDGTGFPAGMAGTLIPPDAAFLSIIGSFDYFNSVHPGKRALGPVEAWGQLQKFHLTATPLQKKFGPTLLSYLDSFFINNKS
ncbi:MAG: hypothetical protein A2X86_03310 [Bdellovibrionales bacterium GWA2_49_15]|nr:MAG: hypothetical protein A2X86_03310 [Bdellovibrionales bacterium GWA2_49_15]HAZ12243.1 hypothetical protein [Bdellovibrionales bacterium]